MKRRYAGTAAALVRLWCRLPGRETPMEKTGYRCHGNTTSAIAPVSWRIVRREVGPGFKSMPFLPQAVCPPARRLFWARSPAGDAMRVGSLAGWIPVRSRTVRPVSQPKRRPS